MKLTQELKARLDRKVRSLLVELDEGEFGKAVEAEHGFINNSPGELASSVPADERPYGGCFVSRWHWAIESGHTVYGEPLEYLLEYIHFVKRLVMDAKNTTSILTPEMESEISLFLEKLGLIQHEMSEIVASEERRLTRESNLAVLEALDSHKAWLTGLQQEVQVLKDSQANLLPLNALRQHLEHCQTGSRTSSPSMFGGGASK